MSVRKASHICLIEELQDILQRYCNNVHHGSDQIGMETSSQDNLLSQNIPHWAKLAA